MQPDHNLSPQDLPVLKNFTPALFETYTQLSLSKPENIVLYMQWFDCLAGQLLYDRIEAMDKRLQAAERIICPA